MQKNPASYPDKALLKGLETFRDPAEVIEKYDQIWTDVKEN